MRKCEGRDAYSVGESVSDANRDRVNRRAVLETAVGSAAAVSLAGCLGSYDAVLGSRSETDDAVTIGLLAPQPRSDYIGRSMNRAAEVAVAELEDEGILGRDVELVVGDTNASPLEAKRQYQRLVLEEGADVTVGVFDSPALVNIMDEIAEQETIHLTTGAATTVASRMIKADYDRYKYHFRAGPTNDNDLARGTLAFLDDMAADIGWESIALIAENYDWTDQPWQVYQDRRDELDLDVVMDRRYPPETRDFSELYGEIAQRGADAAIITTAHTGNEALGYWANGELPFAFGGIHVPMQLPSYFEETNGACESAFTQVTATAQSEVGELTQDFVGAYESAYDGAKPVYTGYHTYDAIMLFAEAVERAESLDADDLVPELEETSFDGATGTVEFYGRNHDYPHDLAYTGDDVLIAQWQRNDEDEGVQEVVWPEKHRTSEFESPPWFPDSE